MGQSPPAALAPWLLAYLPEQVTLLDRATQHFREASQTEAVSYAAEWMLDNLYLARQAARQVHEDMPRSYYGQLPTLAEGPLAGYPRVYGLAQELVAGGGVRLDLDSIRQFLVLYQDDVSLTTGELWALPVMLRFSVLEALARAVGEVTGLERQGTPPILPLPGELTNDEIVARGFTSLRAIATHDWKRFFDAVSRVEQILRGDPAGVYPQMDAEHARRVPEDGGKAGPRRGHGRAGRGTGRDQPGRGG